MEHRLYSDVRRALSENPNPTDKTTIAAILSLITNPFTSEPTVSSLLETLTLHLQKPNSLQHQIEALSLLSLLSRHHPRLRHRVSAAALAFIIAASTSAPSIPLAISLLGASESSQLCDESLFLSLCFWQCVRTRRWALRNVVRFRVRPSVLVTVLLGLTKDPYPYVRVAALDGLVLLSGAGVVVEDRSLIEGCHFRAVELLFDSDSSVRLSAVHVVSEWGRLLVTSNSDKTKGDLSDALFVQLCLMVRDTDMGIRAAAFYALGNIQAVSEDILLQTLSKKALAATKEKKYPGKYTAKVFQVPATAAAFAFVHGLEDEFYQVRKSACRALQMLTFRSAEFAGGAVAILMDMLNDDSVAVRLQALETLHHMTLHDHLKLEESHLHMFFGALVDNNAMIRSTVRKTLQLTTLQKLTMFRSCIDGLIRNLELYPEDEMDIFAVVYKIGRSHGKYVTSIMQEVSQELEPSFDGKLGYNKVRTAALLVLAISAPVSLERQICSIPPQIFSYAVTMLGKLSSALVDVMEQDALLDFLSHCSRFTYASAAEFLKREELDFCSKYGDVHLWRKNDEISVAIHSEMMELKKDGTPLHDYLLNSHVKPTRCMEIVLGKVVDIWPLIQLGCWNEVVRTLRSWKEELRRFTCNSSHPPGVLVFVLKYLNVIKLLGKVWACHFSQRNLQFKGMGVLEALLGKTEMRLKELLYRYADLNRGEEIHILELMLLTYALRLSYGGISSFHFYLNKLNFALSRVEHLCKEGLVELSDFLNELLTVSREIGNSEDGSEDLLCLLQKPLNLFSLKHFELSRELKLLDAEFDVYGNDFQNPLAFISGLPVGIPMDIKLYNISGETRLWITLSAGEKPTQFIFLDLQEFEERNGMREFTFVAPFLRTPKVKYFSLMVSIAMECLSEDQDFKHRYGPKHELVHLCKGKEVHLSMTVK